MRHPSRQLSGVFALLCALTASSVASAQATRTWVSGVGNDANPCSRTAPCKTFAGAFSKTLAGGEISVLDPGGFGAVTITKSLTISGDGSLAGIVATSGSAIIVSAGATDKVVLRNLSLQGEGMAANGIRFLTGAQLVVDNVSINNFTSRGIDVARSASGLLMVTGSRISNVPTGIRLNTTAGTVGATLDRLSLDGLTTGVNAATGSDATLTHSTINGSATQGVVASASGAQIAIEDCVFSFGATGVNASVAGATIRVANSGFFANGQAVSFVVGATVESAGNNRFGGNVGGTAFTGAETVN